MSSKLSSALVLLSTTVLLAFAPQKAAAGILIEPSLGYAIGDLNVGIAPGIGGGTLKYDLKGVSLGARLGYAFPLVFLALDTNFIDGSSKAKSDDAPNATAKDSDVKMTTVAAVVGLDLPLIRVFVGPFTQKTKSQGSGSESSYKGEGIKAGVSFTGLPFVALNLEYFSTKYSSVTDDGVEYEVGPGNAVYDSMKSSMILATVSLPLDF